MATPEKVPKPDAQGDGDMEIQEIIEKIDEIQNQVDNLNEKASEEILKVEQKYNAIRKPYYEKRSALINDIPHFWAVAFMNHPQFSTIISGEDEQILEYLDSLNVIESEDIKSGYKIIFHFKPNPFFKNDALIKTFHNEGNKPVEKTKIEWYPGKEPKSKPSKQNSMHGSFFTFFNNNSTILVEDLGEVIKDDLWNNPVQYYLASEVEVEDDDEDEEEEEEEEEGNEVEDTAE